MSRRRQELIKFIKYCMVGVLNTLVCLGVIYMCKSILGINPYVCNILGYTAGVINSFLCNKSFVFHSKGSISREAMKFLVGFAVCYLLQLGVVWLINRRYGAEEFDILGIVLSGYGVATLLGNVVYTLANFIYNRLVTFR